MLGSDNGVAAFQTPLATGHIFNGFADVFLVTPPTGLQDFYVDARYKVSAKSGGAFSYFDGLLLIAQYHEFRSAVRDLDYGSEFDFYAYLPLRNGVYAQLKYANYHADEFFTDVEKVILRPRLPILMGRHSPQLPLWVRSGHSCYVRGTAAYVPKADIGVKL